MNFKYFRDPLNFAYLSDKSVSCSVCKEVKICFEAGGYVGLQDIDNICEDCLKAGKLIELGNEANLLAGDYSSEAAMTIAYKTPAFPNWQDTAWPIINEQYPVFERIASKEDFNDKQEFIDSFIEEDEKKSDISWLWDMLPDKALKNYNEAPDVSIYLFSLNNRKYWVWDAS